MSFLQENLLGASSFSGGLVALNHQKLNSQKRHEKNLRDDRAACLVYGPERSPPPEERASFLRDLERYAGQNSVLIGMKRRHEARKRLGTQQVRTGTALLLSEKPKDPQAERPPTAKELQMWHSQQKLASLGLNKKMLW